MKGKEVAKESDKERPGEWQRTGDEVSEKPTQDSAEATGASYLGQEPEKLRRWRKLVTFASAHLIGNLGLSSSVIRWQRRHRVVRKEEMEKTRRQCTSRHEYVMGSNKPEPSPAPRQELRVI
ncbi:hypothetical protein H920_06327 [Fukomys damarensis]|uniref:Uncharacterized protein n=1 Tax=Fukomys damarensis TaxID=885580 RepID=A0A091DJF1_FUKDA|nr:hypothetical protein H920_06327 [Fukomys damarensis]